MCVLYGVCEINQSCSYGIVHIVDCLLRIDRLMRMRARLCSRTTSPSPFYINRHTHHIIDLHDGCHQRTLSAIVNAVYRLSRSRY